jgi:Flp pilus assembly protein TadG
VFLAGRELDEAVAQASRSILTGQAQNANMSQSQFATYVCSQVPALFNCNNIAIDVQSYSSFSAVSFPSQIDSHGNFISSNLGYNPGGPGCIVLVRVFYPWQLFVTGLGYNISNMSNSQRLLMATAAFQNEPYTSGTPCS